MLLGRDLSHRRHHVWVMSWAAAGKRQRQCCLWPVPLSSAQPVGSGFARTRSCFGNSLTQESRFILSPFVFLFSPPSSFFFVC